MPNLLGIDVGTSGCKAILIDGDGRVLRQASAEYPLSTPRPLWSEQNPEDWWSGVQSCLQEIGEIPDAIGVTGQMHGAVFLDERDEVIRPAILWNDQRTEAECRQIDEVVGPARVRAITCNPPLTGFQAPKLLWLRNQEPENFARVRSLLLPKDYIRFKLTGEKATDVSDASGTGLFDVPHRHWSEEMMALLDLEPRMFPVCRESFVDTGSTAQGTPVIAGGGDQAAGAVGTGAVAPGVVSVSLGTSGVVFTALPSAEYDPAGAAHTFCHANGAWHAMSVMLSCGGALRWYRDTFCPGTSFDAIMGEAAQAPAGALGATFLPYLSGERSPHNDPRARGSLSGLTLSHERAHLSRAVVEGISFGLLDGFNLLSKLGARADEIRVTGGGAKSAFWVQLLSDLFGKPCSTLECDEGPGYGAAILAGVGLGHWSDVRSACRDVVRVEETRTPSGVDYAESYARFGALYPSLRKWNEGIHA
jgi:xylulokinase